jgi:MFS family permease
VIVGAIMSILDTTIVNVALESLARDLDAPLSTIQWVATGYLLALATVIPLTGLGGRALRAAPRVDDVVAGLRGHERAVRLRVERRVAHRLPRPAGLAGGMIMPIGMITLAQAAGPQRVGRVMSVVGVPMLLGPVLGPSSAAARHPPVVALDLLRQPADRRRRARARGAAAARGARRGRRGGPGAWTGAGCCCSRPASRSWSSASARSRRTAR